MPRNKEVVACTPVPLNPAGFNRSAKMPYGVEPRPFRFIKVGGAGLTLEDWAFSGRSDTSRRTITASVTRSGFEKMEANWIYRV